MARYVVEDYEYNGAEDARKADRLLMNFPAANRDPEKFENPDKVILDRAENPHIAFGVGIHRCAGSNLARMEMRVSIEEWLKRIPDFRLEDPAQSHGQAARCAARASWRWCFRPTATTGGATRTPWLSRRKMKRVMRDAVAPEAIGD